MAYRHLEVGTTTCLLEGRLSEAHARVRGERLALRCHLYVHFRIDCVCVYQNAFQIGQ